MNDESKKKQELALYREQVRYAVKTNSRVPFDNHSTAHARIVAEEFLESAQLSIDIFCGNLSMDVYGGDTMLEIFRKVVERGSVAIRLIVERGCCKASRLATFILGHRGNVCYLPPAVAEKATDIPHFFVVDNKRYRLEPKDGDDRQAVACADGDDENMASKLSVLFNHLYEKSLPLGGENQQQ